jgi:hypothetical protein
MTAMAMASWRLSLSVRSRASRIQARSAPALNIPPAPRTNTTRTPSAPCRVSKASESADIKSASKAFFFDARLRITVAAPSIVASMRTRSEVGLVSGSSTSGSEIGLGMADSLLRAPV